ncbi:MAG: hypothetical protein A4E38_01311 [Methanoregulaceae archaeon PtaB.Bin108]|nr:MAG: hypothetical protein A4E38_01311 [Methanoregulaceae archaeon PtaB.Bin108]
MPESLCDPGRTGCNIYVQCVDIGYQDYGGHATGQDNDLGAVISAGVFPMLLTGIRIFSSAGFPRTWLFYPHAENTTIPFLYV